MFIHSFYKLSQFSFRIENCIPRSGFSSQKKPGGIRRAQYTFIILCTG